MGASGALTMRPSQQTTLEGDHTPDKPNKQSTRAISDYKHVADAANTPRVMPPATSRDLPLLNPVHASGLHTAGGRPQQPIAGLPDHDQCHKRPNSANDQLLGRQRHDQRRPMHDAPLGRAKRARGLFERSGGGRPGPQQVCPGSTTTYTLRVVRNDGGQERDKGRARKSLARHPTFLDGVLFVPGGNKAPLFVASQEKAIMVTILVSL